MIRALLIAGPTASGKSAVALALARRLGGRIVNADSMQVYRDLARADRAAERGGRRPKRPHLLYGEIDGAVNFSVGRWLERARAIVAEAARSERAADFRRRHGPLFSRADRGAFRHSPRPRGLAGAGARRGRGRCDAGAARPARRRRSVDRRAAAAERPPARAARARSLRRDGPAARRLPRRARRAALAGGEWAGLFLAPERAALNRRIGERFGAMLRERRAR